MELSSLILCMVLSFTSIFHCAFAQIDLSSIVEDSNTLFDELKSSGVSNSSIAAIETVQQGLATSTNLLTSITSLLILAGTLQQDPGYQPEIVEPGINSFINSSLSTLTTVVGLSEESLEAIDSAMEDMPSGDINEQMQVTRDLGEVLGNDPTFPEETREEINQTVNQLNSMIIQGNPTIPIDNNLNKRVFTILIVTAVSFIIFTSI